MKKFIVTALIGATVLGMTFLTSCFKKDSDNTESQCQHEHCDEIILTNPTCGKDGAQILICNDCAHSEIVKIPATKEHSYIKQQVIEPTCEEKGYTTHTCECGDSYVDTYVNATGHTFGDWTVTKEATCEEKGEQTRICACGKVESKEIDAIGHNWGAWTVTTQPTCEEKGEETRTCSHCDDVQTLELDALVHKYTNYVSNNDATCTQDGTKTATCDNGCGETHTVTDEGSATGHEYESNVVKDSTCSEVGVKEFVCKYCSHTYQEELPFSEHDYKLVSEQEATCLQAQSNTYSCSICEETYTAYIATNESVPEVTYRTFLHDETNQAYSDVGRTFTVKYPKTIVMEIGSKVDINFETDLTSNPTYELWYLNDSDNYLEVQGTSVVAYANTNQEQVQLGLKFYYIESNYILYMIDVEVIEGHSYEEKVISQEPTCCKEGIQMSTCTACGEQIQVSIPKVYPKVEGVEVKIDTEKSKVYKLSELKELFGDKWEYVKPYGTSGKCSFTCSECGANILLTYTED